MKVFQERDRVIIDLQGRRHDVLLRWREGERLIHALRQLADVAEAWEAANGPSLLTESWACEVRSRDGYVAIRWRPPGIGYPERVPLPPKAARMLADNVEFKLQQAGYRFEFLFA